MANASINDHFEFEEDIKIFFDAIVAMFDNYRAGLNRNEVIDRCREIKEKMSSIYTSGISNRFTERPDFDDQWTRWTYMYTYLSRHVHLVYGALMKGYNHEEKTFETLKSQPTVCSIGGGPNTDALGLCLFLRAISCNVPLIKHIYILDKYVQWEQSWVDMKREFPEDLHMWIEQTEWNEFDMLTPASSLSQTIGYADIITMVKSLSSVAELGLDRVERTVSKIMQSMKTGALLLFIDNKAGKSRAILKKAFNMNRRSHRIILKTDLGDVKLSNKIYSDTAKMLIQEIGHHPVLRKGDNVMILITRYN